VSDVGLTHVALPVSSLDAALRFYERYARMQVVHRRPDVVWLSDKTRNFVIVLIESPEVRHPLRPVGHLGVGCETREEVTRLSERARDEGCLVEGPTDYGPPVGYWAFLSDPDGHTLELSFGQEVALTIEESS
jgi:catechol 2,3-dioxygenase-like lactoylglutathione lyase family enzyme